MNTDKRKEYFAFISYKREDEKWAKWLQHKLEHYHLPSNVRKANESLPKSIRPIFKDTSELSAGVLADEIHEALEKSKYLIVMCSPRAAQSQWVGKEVQSFIDMGRTKQIIPFIIGGTAFAQDPNEECFPSALLNLPKEQELLGVNINEMGRDAAAVKVVARMFDLKFDTLWQRWERDKRNQRNRKLAIIAGIVLLFAIGASISLYKIANERDRANAEAKRANTEANRANAEKKKTEQANASLEVAYARLKIKNDSIELQNKLIAKQKNDLNKTNASLAQTIMDLHNSQDSVLKTNNLLARANNELVEHNNTIERQNLQITQSRDSLLYAKTRQDLLLAKAFLFQGVPEQSVVSLYSVKQNYHLLDSVGREEYSNILTALNDTISIKPFSLVSITPYIKKENPSILENEHISVKNNEDAEDFPTIILKGIDKTDTIEFVNIYSLIKNNTNTHMAIYDYPSGISIYSLLSGDNIFYLETEESYMPNSSSPVALNNTGDVVVYTEGSKFNTTLYKQDALSNKRELLREWFYNLDEEVSGGFSYDDKYFFCRYGKSKIIEIYQNATNKLLFRFNNENFDALFWEGNRLCMENNGFLYKWEIDIDNKNRIYKDMYPIIGVTISSDKKFLAALNSMGDVVLRNSKTNKGIKIQKVIDYPGDIGFTQDGKYVWCMSSFSTIKSLDVRTKKIKKIFSDEYDFNSYGGDLCFPPNKTYCIAFGGNGYIMIDTQSYRVIKVEMDQPYDYITPERFYLDSETAEYRTQKLTSRRYSNDGTMRIEGYSDGTVKVLDSTYESNILKIFAPPK